MYPYVHVTACYTNVCTYLILFNDKKYSSSECPNNTNNQECIKLKQVMANLIKLGYN